MDERWRAVKEKLQESLSKGQYDLWVSQLEFLGQEDGRMLLGCKNRFHIEWLREKLEIKLYAAALQFFPQVRKFEYVLIQNGVEPNSEEDFGIPQQITIGDVFGHTSSAFNPRFTFDHFVIGNCNQFAYASAMALANGQQFYNQSVYLLSETGLGKSHLSHAVGNYLHHSAPGVRVQYITAEQFANEMISSLRGGTMEAFKNKFRTGCDVLLLEKVEFLSGKEKVQSELVYTLDELMDRGKRVLCTGNAYPKDIPKMNGDLQSRLSGILVAAIDRPDFETRKEIIRRKSHCEGVRLPDEVMEYLADKVTGDIRLLESCLVGIMAKTNILNVPVTMDLACEITQNMLERLPKITVEHIQQVICSTFQVSLDDLKSTKRRKELALARKVGMFLSRQYTSESLESIGKSFKRSHSSVLYAINDLSKGIEEEKSSKLKRQVEYVSRRLDASCLS